MFSYRAAAKSDEEWLYQLKCATLGEYVRLTWGRWDDAEQRVRFLDSLDLEHIRIVAGAEGDIGALTLHERDDHLFLTDIALLPEAQGRGFGTHILQQVLERARVAAKPVRLQVLKVNPARRLYERLGFRLVAETSTHFVMEHPTSSHP